MKLHLTTFLLLMTALPCWAEYRTWTNSEGQKAELDLYEVKEVGGEKVGSFRMKSGKTVQLKTSQLSPEDAKILAAWAPSVFEQSLKDNLLVYKDGRMQPVRDHKTPNKYYAFYFTASWCGPCQQFTPFLVKWYQQNKNDNFELVLISWDREKGDMLEYSKSKNMPWPQLQLSEVQKFCNTHNFKVNSIPKLLVCDRSGKVLGDYRDLGLSSLTELVK